MFTRLINPLKSGSFFLFGARGTGKTTFLKDQFLHQNSLVIDLLENQSYAELQARPERLESRIGSNEWDWILIDEVQRIPSLLDEVHRLIESKKLKFILTGSSARKLKRGAANLLAGRAFVYKLFPFSYLELQSQFKLQEVLSYGALPRVFALSTHREKISFLRSYAETYLKEEILVEQIVRNLPPFRRFLEIAAHQDTELVSYSNIARDIGVDPKIVSNYYEILEDTLLGFKLLPYHTSIRAKQKKASKFYWFDLGVVRTLSARLDAAAVPQSFEYGTLFESFIVNEIHRLMKYSERSFSLSFLRIDEKNEIDLIIERTGLPTYAIEIKSTERAHEGHIKNLAQLAKGIKNCIPVLLSNDPHNKTINGVTCHHWQEGFKELGIYSPIEALPTL